MRLDTALNIADLRVLARRRLPRGIFDYIDRGAEDEVGIRRLREAFEAVTFNPRVLVDISERQLTVNLLGQRQSMPLVVAPTASAGLVWYQGETALARAAQSAGIPFCVATESITSIEQIAAATSGSIWFQLYMWQDQALSYDLLDRAKSCGVETLVLTVDTAAPLNREYNIRNGYGVPIRASVRNTVDMMLHPSWAMRVLGRYIQAGGMPAFQHYPEAFRTKISAARTDARVKLANTLTWDDFAVLRRRWPGKLVLKGILRVDDARRAAKHGADAIIVSNHGARNLDGAIAPIQILPAIADAVASRMDVIADSGVRRGSDVLKLLACGAKAVLVGRAALFGTAAGGEAGARRAFEILRTELDGSLGLLGCKTLQDLDRSFVTIQQRLYQELQPHVGMHQDSG